MAAHTNNNVGSLSSAVRTINQQDDKKMFVTTDNGAKTEKDLWGDNLVFDDSYISQGGYLIKRLNMF